MNLYFRWINIPIWGITVVVMLLNLPVVYGVFGILMFFSSIYVYRIMEYVIGDPYQREYQLLSKAIPIILMNAISLFAITCLFVQMKYFVDFALSILVFLSLMSIGIKVNEQHRRFFYVMVVIYGITTFSPYGYYLLGLLSIYFIVNAIFVIYKVKVVNGYYD